MAAWKCGVLVTYQTGLELGRGLGRETIDCRGILGDSKWRLIDTFLAFEDLLPLGISEIIMETFTLGITSCLNMNASFYADSVNAATWNKARLFFWVGCVFAGNGFMQIHEINTTGKFSKRPWNLWKASTVHQQSKYWRYWSVFFDWDRKGAIYGEKGQL